MLGNDMCDLISVIVPVYKVEKYLERCVDSILKQTYINIEVILVDDGSPDLSGDICDQYKMKDSRIKVIHKENGGLSDARNVGIEMASGKYLTFIDSDDWIDIHYIYKLYTLLKSTNSEIAVCDFLRTSNEKNQFDNTDIEIREFSNIEALEQLNGELNVQMVIACAKLYNSALFQKIRFPIGKLHEDEFTTYRLIYNSPKTVLTTERLYYYWQRDDSITGTKFNLRSKLDAIEAIEERALFFERIGQPELKAKTIKDLFYVYKNTNDSVKGLEKNEQTELFREKKRILKFRLRETNQKICFRILYELYFISPKATAYILDKLNKFKHLLRK
ncbi:glycosyltransferase family 2 protein [Acetobacterium wieringae]|uniref:Putative glycosyltransferase EpsJ n=1 Tax=Acetobacterium wieringae TaxID=52694 RepID=A0A1F2PKX8_9FIRM|nr:glycosyltransferase family 2 protein [Acetobacterium wieringae]OFV71346.1 putative glycosyltransferase EpsJ [Acetobacterium wieringae]